MCILIFLSFICFNKFLMLSSVKIGAMLELSEAIRDYHDLTEFPQMVSMIYMQSPPLFLVLFFFLSFTCCRFCEYNCPPYFFEMYDRVKIVANLYIILTFQNNSGSSDEFFLATDLDSSGSPPKRAPPPVPAFTPPPPVYTPPAVITPPPIAAPSLTETNVSRSESLESSQTRELTVDDIEDFEDDEDLEVNSVRMSRRNPNDAADLALKLPSFSTGINKFIGWWSSSVLKLLELCVAAI